MRPFGFRSHSSHWGSYAVRSVAERLVVVPDASDGDPSPLLANIPDSVRHVTRVSRPLIRRGWLRNGPGAAWRDGDFVPVDWDTALDLIAAELRRVIDTYGNVSIYGGSYGWSSAGRFHHAQSQLHRFLNAVGGYVRSVGTYSAGAAGTFLPYVAGPADEVAKLWTTWDDVTNNTRLLLAFGGLPTKNNFVASGGIARHPFRKAMSSLRERGCKVVSLGPLGDDGPADAAAQWVPVKPFGDVPLLLAMSHVLVREGLHDENFLRHYTVGADRYLDYLRGRNDGVPKSPDWATQLCGVPVSAIEDMAHAAASRRTLVNITHSLQRARHGEQPIWAALAFACLLGQVGLPGGGFSYSLGSMGNNGVAKPAINLPSLPQGINPVANFIPVARVADMLLNPGDCYQFNGEERTYPQIRMVYWAGGNPFHHHQDLFQLQQAFAAPDTIVVHEQYLTATARHADIVLPATLSLEREDIGGGRHDTRLIAMQQVLEPYADARDDYAIFTALAQRLGIRDAFTEGRTAGEWIRHLYDGFATSLRERGADCPDFDTFWTTGAVSIPPDRNFRSPIQRFRQNPKLHPLATPSGRIELFSRRIASYRCQDCPPHPTWLESSERLTEQQRNAGELQLVANNPETRLHSQLDMGEFSQQNKVAGVEAARLHPTDAQQRGITSGDLIRIHNQRGACLAGAQLSDNVMPGVIQLSTGAWFTPGHRHQRRTCLHGNPNAVTRDIGTSSLGQGCSGQLCRVRVELHLLHLTNSTVDGPNEEGNNIDEDHAP